jgi:hypothetical protein
MLLIGLDIGEGRNPSALGVAQSERRDVEGRQEIHFVVRHLERLPAGSTYPSIARRAAEIVEKLQPLSRSTPMLYVNATGLGRPIVDLLTNEGLRPVPCYFNHGDRVSETDSHEFVVGKALLVARLKVMLQSGRLHLPETPDARLLSEELYEYKIHPVPNADEISGAFRVGPHDDLVTALGLAVLSDEPLGRTVMHLISELAQAP